MLTLRSFLLLLAGFTLFSDEQERFICNTIQPGCSNVCFDVFAPVSVLRLWLFHLILLCLPHFMFATYVVHKVLSYPFFENFDYDRSGESSPSSLENSSKEPSVQKATSRPTFSRECRTPRFHCAYFCVVIIRIILEVSFSAAQYFLIGLTIPKSFFCYETPCTSGVECYISRPTEKTLMLNFMLGIASLSILLSLIDLISSVKAMIRWRRKKERLTEEMNKGEQSSVFTTMTSTEDSDVLLTKRISPSGISKMNGKPTPSTDSFHSKVNGGPTLKDGKVDSRSSTPTSTPVPPHHVPHSYSKPPLSSRPDRRTLQNLTPMGAKKLGQHTPAGTSSGQPSDNSECQDKRAWV
ncbi:gap junction delta-4 protein-like [Gouania willdenowi]|uniref:Gap junction protein n=1 Tax=Gouania willdenowi TaxID=441366 RepID=A0A8C5NHC3_GOUWI|nr:gap junction delta-4 protein-like [Gouania willdenowi]